MEQQIRFCTTADGVRLAYGTVGHGPALVYPPRWVSNLEVEWETDEPFRAFCEALAAHHTLVRYDRWGTGLSDRERDDFSLESEVRSLVAVVDHLRVERIALFGQSAGGPVSIAYTAQYPDRVSHLMLFGTWARRDPEERTVREAVTALLRAHWGLGTRTLADQFMPSADAGVRETFTHLQSAAATAEMAIRLREFSSTADVSMWAPQVRVPTLVLHRRDDQIVPLAVGLDLATRIPGARFVSLEGDIHGPHGGDTAAVREVIAGFLGDPAPVPSSDVSGAASPTLNRPSLTIRQREVLDLVAAGYTNKEIAAHLHIAVSTVERHLVNLYTKVGARGRAEAVAYALRRGLNTEANV